MYAARLCQTLMGICDDREGVVLGQATHTHTHTRSVYVACVLGLMEGNMSAEKKLSAPKKLLKAEELLPLICRSLGLLV